MISQRTWDTEACLLSATTRVELIERAEGLARFLSSAPAVTLKDIAYTLSTQCAQSQPCQLAIVAASPSELAARLAVAIRRLSDPQCARIKDPSGIYYFQEPLGLGSKLAFLFPGEGAQYPNMLLDLCLHFPEVRAWFDLIDRAFIDHPRQYLPSQVIFALDPSDAAKQLWQMDAAIEVVFTASQALYGLLSRLSIRPDVIVGHSSGEYSALLASGALRIPSDERLIQHILDLNGVYEQSAAHHDIPEALLLAVGAADPALITRTIEQSEAPLYVAVDNCPHQVVLCGTPLAVRRAAEQLQRAGAVCEELPFQRAYHTPLFEPLTQPLREFFGRLDLGAAPVELYSCATAAPYPSDPEAIRELAATQWTRPVRFRETVEAMYAADVRIFVEVGPRGNLTAFVDDILRGRPSLAVASNLPNRSGVTQLNHLVALLAAQHVPLNLEYLYARRAPQHLSFEADPARGSTNNLDRGAMSLSLRLPSLHLSSNGTVLPAPPTAKPAQPLSPPTPAALGLPVASPAQLSPRAQVLSEYLNTMDRFLATQQAVMQTFLSGAVPNVDDPKVARPAAPPLLPASVPPADISDNVSAVTPLEEKQGPADFGAITHELLTLISERTGYPVQMLEPQVKLEADLGIDSIKRVEILGEFQRRTGAVDQADLEALSRMTTLQQIVDLIGERREGSAPPAPLAVATANLSTPNAPFQLPFIRQIVSHTPGRELVAVCAIDLEEDLFLKAHTLAGKVSLRDDGLVGLPVMPLTVSIEILAEAAFMLQPQRVIVGMKNVRAYRWLTAEDDRLMLHLTARLLTGDEVEVQLHECDSNDPSRPKPGLPVIEAVALVADGYPPSATVEAFDLSAAQASKWRPGAMYAGTGMFHGSPFQWVERMDRVGADGAIATLIARPNDTFFRSNPQPTFLIDPALLDAMGQIVGFWTGDRFQVGLSVFPFKLERLELYGPPLAAGEETRCYVRVNFVDEDWIRSNIEAVRPDGTLVARLIQWEDRRLDLPRPLYDFRIAPHAVVLSDEWPAASSAAPALRACRISYWPQDICEAYGAIWLRVLSYMLLGRRERKTWQALNGASRKRRFDWLMGRVAAKDALRLLLKDQLGLLLCPADIEITTNDHGRPEVGGSWLDQVKHRPIVSIAHSGKLAVGLAAASPAVHGLGIDLEPADGVRPDVERVAFTPHERQWLSSINQREWSARLWCAKEAVGKAIGRGLNCNPCELEMQEVDRNDGAVAVKLLGGLARELPELADQAIVAHTWCEDNWVIATALI